MGIFEKQYSKIVAEELLRFMLEGKIPSSEVIAERMSKVLNQEGGITYQYFAQPSRSVFQIEQYNNALKQIKFDIDLFQEELLDLFGESTRRVNFAELYYKIHSHELKNLKSKLESILFSVQDADYYFSGAYDNFSDTSKTNLELSTPTIVDLREGALDLPYGGRNTSRISLLHLASYRNWKVESNLPESIVIQKGQLDGTNFSDIFTNIKASWAYQVVTTERTPVTIKFVIPIAGSPEEEAEIFLNRLELSPHSLGKQNILVRLSNDNVNYFAPIGYESGIMVDDATKVYAMDFETTLVQYVEFTFTKENPDDTIPNPDGDGNRYQYVFGLSHFAAFATGRVLKATYYSKPFRFDSTSSISKIALSSNFFRPPGTSIKYQVALSDDEGNVKTNFFSVNPIGKEVTSGAPQVLNLKNSNYKSEKFAVALENTDSSLQYGPVIRSRRLYKIKDRVLPSPIFDSIELVRGYGAWSRDSSASYDTLSVPDCYVDFSNLETENLYYIKSEAPLTAESSSSASYSQFTNVTQTTSYTQPIQDIKLTLKTPPYYILANGHLMRPSLSLQGAQDPAPKYAIYSIKRVSESATRSSKQFDIRNGVYPQGNVNTNPVTFNLPVSDFVVNSPDPSRNPVIRAQISSSGPTYVLTPVLDYDLETVTIDNVIKPTGKILIKHHAQSLLRPLVSNNTPTVGSTLTIEYTPEQDITHKISAITGNEVIISKSVYNPGDTFEVVYRALVQSPSEIIRNSVKVYDKPLSDPSTRLLREGIDYSLNAVAGTLTRLGTGTIPTNGSVYVVYQIKLSTAGLERFSTWCKIENPDGIEIRFFLDRTAKKPFLFPDYSAGEKLFISTSSSLIEITNSISTPRLSPGWIQFIVISKNPEANPGYSTNLINQVIQLQDINGQRIFREQSKYFNSILAYREPMVQKTLNDLRFNTLTEDTRSFAVDESDRNNPVVLVNFLPNKSSDLYSYGPTSYKFLYPIIGPSDVDIGIGGLSVYANPIKIPESYSIVWYYSSTDPEDINNNVVVRIDLEQDPKTDGSVTPKVFDYQLRVGF